ncbi:unnamed protein product, partial [Ectocarpus sp. 12 AP-2014]
TKEISFSLNGKDLGPAFTLNDEEVKGLYPAASLHFGQAVVFNFGRAPFEYNPRERGSKPQEPAIIEAPAKPKSRRKSTPTKPAAAAAAPAAPAAAAAAAAAAVGPRAGKGKRAKGERAGAGGADGVDDEPASDGDAEPVYVDKKAAGATGGSGGGSSSVRSNGHTQAGGRGKGSNNASSAGVDVESVAQAEFDRQTKEIDGLLRHETLLEGMHEMHTR